MFNLKGDFAKVASVVESEWTKIKEGAADADTFLTNNQAAIAKYTAETGAVLAEAIPATGPAVTAIETLETKVMAIVIAGAGEIAGADSGNALQTVTALKALLPQLAALGGQIAAKPAVVAVNAAAATK